MLIDGCQQLGYHVRVAPNNMIQSAVSEKDRGEGESVVFMFCFDISLISILHRDFFFSFVDASLFICLQIQLVLVIVMA